MAGENNILDDFELDLDIETITLDDIDISVIDEIGDSPDSVLAQEDLAPVALDDVSEEPMSIDTMSEPEDQDTLMGEAPVDIPEPTPTENIGTDETLQIIDDTPEPAIIEEQEIKPVEEIRSEAQDKTFDEDHALEEAYVFDADDEIISIDGSELDNVIYGEEESVQDLEQVSGTVAVPETPVEPAPEPVLEEQIPEPVNIGDIEVVDKDETADQTESMPLSDEPEEVLLEVENIMDTGDEPAINKSVELETLDQDDNYVLQMETVKSDITSVPETGLELDIDSDDEPIALSMEELNDIEVSDEAVTPVQEVPLESPLNADSDFSPVESFSSQVDPAIEEDPGTELADSIELGESIEIPEAPTDLSASSKAQPTDVEELYSIYNGENAIKAEADEETLVASSDDLPDFSQTPSDIDFEAEAEAEIINLEEDDLVVPLTEDYQEDESVLEAPFESADETEEISPEDEPEEAVLETDFTSPISKTSEEVSFETVDETLITDADIEVSEETVLIEPQSESVGGVSESEMTVPDDDDAHAPNISTKDSELEDDENIPYEEEIQITQNDFIEMANLEETENGGDISTDDLDKVSVEEPSIVPDDAVSAVEQETGSIPGMDSETDVMGEEISLSEDTIISEPEGIEEITLDDELTITDNESIDTIEGSPLVTEIPDESSIIASAPDAVGMLDEDVLPVPQDLTDEIDEIEEIDEDIIADENVTPEMYNLESTQEEKEQIITEKVDTLSSETKDEMKKVLNYLDGLLEDLPEEKIKEFSQSDYYDLYVKILDKLGV